jgi:hypothetical protein
MAHLRSAVHRTILVVDVEGFGDPRRANPHQVTVRDGLYRALRNAFDTANIPWEGCHREDRGDGVFILAPPEVPKIAFVEALPPALVQALREHNSTHCAQEQIRLRMALHAGEITYDDHGVTAASINLTFRLLEARPLKAALAASPGVLALITSAWFFDEVVRHSTACDPATYRPAKVVVKETTTTAWLSLPDHPYPPRNPASDTSRIEHWSTQSRKWIARRGVLVGGLGLRRWVLIVGGLFAAVTVVTVWGLTQDGEPRISSMLGFLVAVLGVLVVLAGVRAKSDSKDGLLAAARQLARDVRGEEAGVLIRLMADSGDPVPADVSFAQPALIYWRVDGGDQRGTLSEITGYYRNLDRGRLVVLGEPGAGKTVLAIQLVLDLAAAVLAMADTTSPLPRVPVRLSLPAFDPGDDVDMAAAKVVSERLDRWLIRHLVTVFGLRARVAATLVKQGWILPILDGLDEMDLDDTVPRRAAAVIRVVNHPSAGGVRPVVITCRTNRYQQLSGRSEFAGKASSVERETTSIADQREVVQDATVVGVEPLTAPSVLDYLTYRFPDPADPSRIEPRWRPIAERLTANNGGSDPLAATLSSPLRLFLAVTAYRHPTSTPAELTRLVTAAQLDEHLFARLIPAVLEQHPPVGRQYAVPQVTRWLTTLARHLAWQGKRGGSPTDLRLDQLWPAAGRHAPRYAAMTAISTVMSAPLAVGVLARWPIDVLPILGAGVLVVVAGWMALRPAVELRRLDLSGLRTSAGRRRIGRLVAVGLAAGLVGGLMTASMSATVIELVGRLMIALELSVIGLVGALIIEFSSGPATRPTVIDRPARLVQQGLLHTVGSLVGVSLFLILIDQLVTGGLSSGIMGQIVAGLGALLGFGFAIGPIGGLAIALALGLNSNTHIAALPFAMVAIMVGLIFAANAPWSRYLFAVLFLARRGDLPMRPAAFLDWAYQAGLMRLSGIAVQFRHREFQTWLATHGQPGDTTQARLLATGTTAPSTGIKDRSQRSAA